MWSRSVVDQEKKCGPNLGPDGQCSRYGELEDSFPATVRCTKRQIVALAVALAPSEILNDAAVRTAHTHRAVHCLVAVQSN